MASLFSMFRKVETKSLTEFDKTAAIADKIAADQAGETSATLYSYALASEVLRNPVAKKCVDILATSAGSIRLYATKNGKAVPDTDPLQKLLNQPNSQSSMSEFLDEMTRHYLLAGEVYIHRVNDDRDFKRGFGQIFLVRPDHVNPFGGKNTSYPESWQISPTVGASFNEPVDQITGQSRLLQIRTYNPVELYRGVAPAASAWDSIRAHNSGSQWNANSLDSGASFDMIMQVKPEYLDEVSQEQWTTLQNIVKKFKQNQNSSVLMPNLPVEVKEVSRSPKDMQMIESQEANSKMITVAFGVPGQLANVAGESTYANYEQASYALYTGNVIPMLRKFTGAMTRWLQPLFPGYTIEVDIDTIQALQAQRTEAMSAIQNVNFISTNEKRELFGFVTVTGGDDVGTTTQVTSTEQQPPQTDGLATQQDSSGGNL